MFNGNQTVNGAVTASSFAGNGAGLTGVNASNLTCSACVGNVQLGITYAAGDTKGGNAVNALQLGGLPATAFATLGANNFTANQSMPALSTGSVNSSGPVTIGSGTPIVEHLSNTLNPTFPALKPSTCISANFTFNGASDGDTLALGVPNARTTGGGTIIYSVWVSAANTVTIQACNISASPQKTAGSGAIRVDIWKH